MSKKSKTSQKKNKEPKGKAVVRMPPRDLPSQPAPSNATPVAGNAPTSSSNNVRPPQGNAYIPAAPLRSAPVSSGSANAIPSATPPPPGPEKRACKQIEDDAADDRMAKRRRKKLGKVIAAMARDLKLREQSDELERHHLQARLVGRMIHPFMSPFEALNFGLNSDGDICAPESDSDDEDDDEDSDSGVLTTMKLDKAYKRELLYQFHALLDLIPDLKESIQSLDEAELMTLGDYIKNRFHAARGDDSASLRKYMLPYLQGLESEHKDYRTAPSMIEKYARGWHSWYTARLLCPQNLLAEFDRNAERFSDLVLSGDKKIDSDDFPSFLYDQEAASEDDYLAGLLRGPYLKMCLKSLLTGPSSVKLTFGRKDKTPGKPPIAMKYKLTSVSPRAIAYTAVLVRCELSSQLEFSPTDVGGFNACDFYNNIVELFEDPTSKWCQETLDWWNTRVFGNMSRARRQAPERDGHQTIAEKLRAERRAARKATRKSATHSPELPSED
ncbi:hypothetical protein OH77DRAFT_1432160 [Trametes cingulata]|nr:hypothetical protein OH77DRAFT_1432160 [Trametes cingulata]